MNSGFGRGNSSSRRPPFSANRRNSDNLSARFGSGDNVGHPRRASRERNFYEDNGQMGRKEEEELFKNTQGSRNTDDGNGRGRGGRGRRDRENQAPRPMTYGRLRTWAESEDAGQLVLFMALERKQIEKFLKEDRVKEDWFNLLVKATSHAITAQHQKESIIQLLDVLCGTPFFDIHLTLYLLDTVHQFSLDQRESFFKSVISLLNEILNKVPKHAIKCLSGAQQLLNETAGLGLNQEISESLRAIIVRSKESHSKEKTKQESVKGGGNFTKANQDEKPPDNFLELDVVPTVVDLKEDAKPFIRCAVTKGAYEDVHNYLDIQFRLMRQDFISPLQKGINEFRKNGCKKNFKCSDLRLYFDVHIIGTVFKDGIDHILQFDVSKLNGVKWEFSKRLIFGSLLCLSKDNFETVIFATVVHRDPAELKKGNISVSVKRGLDIIFNSTSSETFIMAETTAYFESYCHVLEGLKEMATNLPLQDYIISCKKDIKPPKYLLPSGGIQRLASYNLSCLLKNRDTREYPVLTTTKWPPAEAMCLNSSQRDAAITALTKEIAVIQGPPGTGKTYVGLKVMQVLLENQEVIPGNESNKKDPILVVCYTNHALEQFLEGVLEFCKEGIIRIGGRNKSEKLEKFNIKHLRQVFRSEKKFFDLSARNSRFECIRELEVVSAEIEKINKNMDSLDTDIQTEDVISDFMLEEHYESFKNGGANPSSGKQQMRQWLNASHDELQSALPRMIKQHMTNLILKLPVTQWDGKINSRMDILQRANIYLNLLERYKQNLAQQMNFASSFQDQFEIKQMLDYTNRKIISDYELPVPQNLLLEISNYLMQDKKTRISSANMIIETWLLGTTRNLNNQLDDVQILTDFLSGADPNADNFDDFEAAKQAQDDRIEDDDDDEKDGENYSTKIKSAKNNIVAIMKRAELLGIEEDVLEADEDEAGWKVKSYSKPLSFGKIRCKIATTKPMTEAEEENVIDIWKLDLNKRFALYNCWIKKYKEKLTEKMTTLVERYQSAYKRKEESSREETLALLKTCKVIGMTTTGAAKHRAVLQTLGCRIIVVEEAAEVLEAHIVTALNKNCNHLILIGDHQQLRPNPTVYELAKHYGLEISLFERLINNQVPHVLLKEQHRMRPEISKIMRHIYKDLEDHPTVKTYESIRGVSKNIFFISHEERESEVEDTRSRANDHEAQYLVALCNYLLMQGYEPSQITILATYTGQVFAIKKILRGDKKITEPDKKGGCVRVTAVDNYQGEENDIILLSLVRSNENSNVGFLKVNNRVCVALSRAKKGLYVIGNFNNLYRSSDLWKNIINEAKADGILADSLELVCPNHPDLKQNITVPSDFKKCPEGGCGQPCNFRLLCGHVCVKKCHGYDPEHKEYVCKKQCPKSCKEGHPCKRKCHQDCGNCPELVTKSIPICGHENSVPCHMSPLKAVCSQRCETILSCEHQCSGKCGQCKNNKTHSNCLTPVPQFWLCGHSGLIPCYMKTLANECQKVCDADLDCGHKCKGKCSECLESVVHISCKEPCNKQLPCGHLCKSTCGVPCPPCVENCFQQCAHAMCSTPGLTRPCSHKCTPCIEKCAFRCAHKACSKLCSEPCDVAPCAESCTRKVHDCAEKFCGGRKKCRFNLQNCDHKCAGLCGEACVCFSCEQIYLINNGKTSLQQVVSSATAGKKGFLIKLPSCKHNFYVTELDEYVNSFPSNSSVYIPCPVCSKPISKCWRYEKINKERNKKRAELKSQLETENTISKYDVQKLVYSQKKITDPQLNSFLYIDTKVSNNAEKQAVSNQFKFAFILSAAYSFVKDDSDMSKLLKLRKDALMKVGKKMSCQYRQEMSSELTRCLQLAYLTELDGYSSLHGVSLPENTLMQVKDSKVLLGKVRPDKVALERSNAVIIALRRLVKDRVNVPAVQARCQLMEESYDRAMQVLKSNDDEMLADIFPTAANATSASSVPRASSRSLINSLSSKSTASARLSFDELQRKSASSATSLSSQLAKVTMDERLQRIALKQELLRQRVKPNVTQLPQYEFLSYSYKEPDNTDSNDSSTDSD